jgi:hypothetical protein
VSSFAKGLGDVGISSGPTNTGSNSGVPNVTPADVEPVSDQFLGAGYVSSSMDAEPGTPPPDWFGSNTIQ